MVSTSSLTRRSSVYWQVKHVPVRHILRVNIVEGRSKPVLLLEGRQAHPNHAHSTPNKETNWCTANMLHSQ